jgi:toxin ParE1/3/4
MPLRIDLTPLARQDLFDIWDYISPNSIQGATRIARDIASAFSMLADTPAVGRSRPELGADLRGLPVSSYLIFYRYDASTLEIVRILHSARDITPEMLTD